LVDEGYNLVDAQDGSGSPTIGPGVTPVVDTKDLIDARGVAEILGLSAPNTVSVYQRRYADMPRPVVSLGRGRCMLWLRSEIERWANELAATGRTRAKRRVTR
jgi:glutathione-regulated potassium-efflux system ancillary protein KefG